MRLILGVSNSKEENTRAVTGTCNFVAVVPVCCFFKIKLQSPAGLWCDQGQLHMWKSHQRWAGGGATSSTPPLASQPQTAIMTSNRTDILIVCMDGKGYIQVTIPCVWLVLQACPLSVIKQAQ